MQQSACTLSWTTVICQKSTFRPMRFIYDCGRWAVCYKLLFLHLHYKHSIHSNTKNTIYILQWNMIEYCIYITLYYCILKWMSRFLNMEYLFLWFRSFLTWNSCRSAWISFFNEVEQRWNNFCCCFFLFCLWACACLPIAIFHQTTGDTFINHKIFVKGKNASQLFKISERKDRNKQKIQFMLLIIVH